MVMTTTKRCGSHRRRSHCYDHFNYLYHRDHHHYKDFIELIGRFKEINGFAAFKRLVSDDPALWERVQEKNKLDVALMEEAERIFEDRLEKMKREKADNVICNFMGKVEVRCANGCGAMNEKL